MKIHLFGASGSGVTTTGKALAEATGFSYFDSDAYYWLPSEPPFRYKRPAEARNGLLRADLARHPDWIFGGSATSWGDCWQEVLDLAVFLWIPPEVRMARLQRREYERYGEVICHDPDRKAQYDAFLAWAARYDDPHFTRRSRTVHEQWMTTLACPVLRLEGDLSVAGRVDRILLEAERLRAGRG
jgi:adenylate kinase family enzyme